MRGGRGNFRILPNFINICQYQAVATLRCSNGVENQFFHGTIDLFPPEKNTQSWFTAKNIWGKVDHRLAFLTHQFSCTCNSGNFVILKNEVYIFSFLVKNSNSSQIFIFKNLIFISEVTHLILKTESVVNFDSKRILPIKPCSLLTQVVLQISNLDIEFLRNASWHTSTYFMWKF